MDNLIERHKKVGLRRNNTKSRLFFRTIVMPFIFLIACQAQAPTSIPIPTATATIIPSPTSSSTPTPDPEIISPANASQLILKFMNMGTARGFPTFSLDGKWLYQESTAGTYAFDTVSYQEVHLVASSPFIIPSPDAQELAKLEVLTDYAVQPEPYETIFSPDGSLIARHFHGGFIPVWRLADGKLLSRLEVEGSLAEISPNNRWLLIGRSVTRETVSHATYTEYYMELYNLQSGEHLGSWSGSRAFFLSNSQLAVESSDGYTRIFDPIIHKVSHAFAGWYAAFSPGNKNLAVLCGNQIFLYEVSTDKLLHKFDSGLPSTDAANLRFSANGEVLAGFTTEYYCCAGYSNRLFVWQVSDGRLLADLSRPETLGQWAESPISLSPDGQAIVIDSRVLRVSDGSLIKDLGIYFIEAVSNLAFTTDGQKIIVLDPYGKVHLYPVDSAMPSIPQGADRETYLPFLQREISCWDAIDVLSPDGQIMALGLPNGAVELWDTQNKQKIYTLLPPTDDKSHSVRGLAFSPDGKLLAVGLLDGRVRLYGLNTR